jgi:hypothetical protein
VEVQDLQHNGTGTYRVYLQRLTSGAICPSETAQIGCDGTVTVKIDKPLDTDLLSFTAADGEWVHIRGRNTVTPSSNPPDIRLLDKTGKQVSAYRSVPPRRNPNATAAHCWPAAVHIVCRCNAPPGTAPVRSKSTSSA